MMNPDSVHFPGKDRPCASRPSPFLVEGESHQVHCLGIHADRWHRAVIRLANGRQLVVRWTDQLL